jgi:hypothetical protein
MMRKFKRGLAAAMAAAMVVSSYAPISFAEEEKEIEVVTRTDIKQGWQESDDGYTYNVVITYSNGSTERLDVKVDKAVKDPTCEEQGVTTYTATYTGKDELGGGD